MTHGLTCSKNHSDVFCHSYTRSTIYLFLSLTHTHACASILFSSLFSHIISVYSSFLFFSLFFFSQYHRDIIHSLLLSQGEQTFHLAKTTKLLTASTTVCDHVLINFQDNVLVIIIEQNGRAQ